MAAAMIEQPSKSERRDFLKVAGAALVTGFPAIISAQTLTNAIKVGLVGCGGRGTGAASQALTADDYSELVAVADIDASQIVWARDLGAEEDEKLRQYYPDRTAWLLEPDFRPPRLGKYQPPSDAK